LAAASAEVPVAAAPAATGNIHAVQQRISTI
jgi:hypothetical protein